LKIRSVQELRKHLKDLANAVPDIQEENSEDVWKELFALL